MAKAFTQLSRDTSLKCGADLVMWHFNGKGLYTVKSGYKLEMSRRGSGEALGPNLAVLWWKMLWVCKVPRSVDKQLCNLYGEYFQSLKGPVRVPATTWAKERSPMTGWRPPNDHGQKINADEAILNRLDYDSIGMVVREGQESGVGAAAAIRIKGHHTPNIAECLAI
ncbi:hypothetical protein L484_004712 [Morus notabilis]|uniref:RNase H type-1 domain-containing protein n=1 Tax=Morus notabilis TaxID=981085 RepID=W9S347_9ROSA|nr:hypothetical protein L484_004712 [Morus notabilis]